MNQDIIHPDKPNQGLWALVTGGASGIGREICKHLSSTGASVIIVDLDENGAKRTADELRSSGHTVNIKVCDVSDFEAVNDMFSRLQVQGIEPEILVNCAGINMAASPVEDIELQTAWRLIHVHLGGTMNCTSKVIPSMRRRHYGRIVMISSRSGVYGTTGQSAYSAAKAGIIGFMKAVAKEVINSGICVNVVAPGWIRTAASEALLDNIAEDKQELLVKGTTEDIASIVSYLCLPESKFINGQTILADGGDGLRYSLDYIFGSAITS